jgi:hypothetical protein
VDFRPETNAVILLDMGPHTKRRMGEIGKGGGYLRHECGCCVHCRGVNKVILNWLRPLWEGDQEIVKRCGRDESMWVSIHKCMEAMLGICIALFISN